MRSPPGAAEAAPAPAGLVALLALASFAYAASFGWTFASHDFIRDLLAAGDIAHGDALPLRGPVINGMVHVGPQWFYVLAVPLLAGGGLLAATLWAGVLAASAMAGLPGLLRAPRPRTLFVAVVGLALLCGAWTTTLRPTSTFYLALMAWPFVVLATALLVQGGDDRGAPPRTFLAITATLSLSLIGSAVVVQQGLSGRITLPLAGMLDVPEGTARATPVATMPVWATESLARNTCHADTVVLRGELAAFLDFYQGMPWRWTCVPTPRTALVATPDNGRVVERAVMTPAALRAIGWPSTSWSAATSIIPARVLSDGPSVPQPTSGARHPHRDFEAAASQAFQRRVVTQPGEILAVYAPLFVFDGGAILEARIGGERIAPTVSTNGGALFEPPPAAAAGDTTWTLFLQGRRPEQIEIFTLRRPEAATGAPLSP